MVDFVSRLNSLRVNRESTVRSIAGDEGKKACVRPLTHFTIPREGLPTVTEQGWLVWNFGIHRENGHVRLSDARVSDEDDLHHEKWEDERINDPFLS